MIETSEILQNALDKGRSADSEAMWRMIAEGKASNADSLVWVEHVARRIVKDVLDNPKHEEAPNRRADHALYAIGFYGPRQKHAAAKEALEIMGDFDDLDNPGRKLSMREKVRAIRHLFNEKTDDQIAKILSRK